MVKKITLPSHPLLSADFKGHTGSILGLDFDGNGKYIASCSNGKLTYYYYFKVATQVVSGILIEISVVFLMLYCVSVLYID